MTDVVMALPRHSSAGGTRPRPAGDLRHRTRESLVLFVAATAVYLLAGWSLIHFNILPVDALSREANAYYVLFSRDPHLPAMGFVWNPLASFSMLPILPLKSLFPGLVALGGAAVIQSALSMAGTVVVLSSCLHKLGVGRNPRLVLVAIFALQPMTVMYGGSGMSEGILLLCLMLTASALISWMQHHQPGSLVAAGIALGFAYLARYEAGASALAVTALVAATTAVSASGGRADRLRLALNDAALVAAPPAFAFFVWAASAKILVDEWFPTFSSQYGNSAQTRANEQGIEQAAGDTVGETLAFLGRQNVGLAPLFCVLLVITAVLAIRKRSPVPLVPVAVFGSVTAFAWLMLLMRLTFGWTRFQITIIPLTALLAGAVIGMLFPQTSTCSQARTTRSQARPTDRGAGRPWRPIIATAGVFLAVAVAIPTQARLLVDPTLNLRVEEADELHALLYPDGPGSDLEARQRWAAEREIAAWLDRRDPGEGTVLVDSAYGYAIILSSANPRQFVITSDRDFQTSVDDPGANGIKYILVQADKPADAVQVRWPTLFADGAGIGILRRSWGFGKPGGEWRLYAVS